MISKQSINSVFWVGTLKGLGRVVTLGKIAVLARFLSPLEFGLFGIASLAISLLETVTDTGINVFIIQREGELKEYINTAWVISIIRGIIIFLLLAVFSPLISVFFKQDVTFLIFLIGFASFLRGFINPSIVTYQKELLFKKEFYLRFSIILTDALVAIALGIKYQRAFALVLAMIAGVLVELVISYVFIKPHPKLIFEKEKFKKVLSRGKWVTAAGIFQYLFANGDNLTIGRILNAGSLGLYQMAYRISTIPITEISDVFSRVTFPMYAKNQEDKKYNNRLLLKSTIAITIITLPIGILLFIFTKPIVEIFLGQKWMDLVMPLKILSIFGVIRAIEGVIVPYLLAYKKQEQVSAITLISLLGMAVSIIPLTLKYNITGSAYSVLFASLFVIPYILFLVKKEVLNS